MLDPISISRLTSGQIWGQPNGRHVCNLTARTNCPGGPRVVGRHKGRYRLVCMLESTKIGLTTRGWHSPGVGWYLVVDRANVPSTMGDVKKCQNVPLAGCGVSSVRHQQGGLLTRRGKEVENCLIIWDYHFSLSSFTIQTDVPLVHWPVRVGEQSRLADKGEGRRVYQQCSVLGPLDRGPLAFAVPCKCVAQASPWGRRENPLITHAYKMPNIWNAPIAWCFVQHIAPSILKVKLGSSAIKISWHHILGILENWMFNCL